VKQARSFACALALAVGSSSLDSPASGTQRAEPGQKEFSRELERIFGEHFADQGAGGDPTELEKRRAARIRRVLEIVDLGRLATLDDWDHAAVVLAYADDVEHILLGHALVVRPAIADVALSRQLLAFGFDHYLQNVGQPALFGTHIEGATVKDVLAIDDRGEPLPECLRKLFLLEPLRERGKKSGKKPSPKDLAQLAAAAKTGEPAAWLPRLRELVASGVLDSSKDWALGAELLAESQSPKDLLLAHVLCLGAAFEKHPQGQALAARSLDRYLLATGRGQLLGTVPREGGRPAEPVKLAPRVVLEGYGSLEGAREKGR
jgi:hypothetical protein